MTTNGVIVEDAEMAECDGEKVVTMMDVLQEEQDFEDDANAVLGASDDKNCTYSKGYIKRQALYACLTCCTEAKLDPTKRAGVCLACSLNCHENHELVELYTKRNFRCDCGNPKFNSHPCQFTPNKTDLNEENIYNQNFSGLYCICQRPYPDPDSTVEDDEMIQCIICEDWLHASHLDATVPGVDQYSEMVCKICMEKNEFLHDYNKLTVNVETQDVDIVGIHAETKLSNGDLTEKLVNGDNSIDITEKIVDNVDVDEAQNDNNTLPENSTHVENVPSQIEDSENKVKMEVLDTETPSEITSEANPDPKQDSTTDITTEETSKLNEDTLEKTSEDTAEDSTAVTEEKSEETNKETEDSAANPVSEAHEFNETVENVPQSKDSQNSVNNEKPEKIEHDNVESEKPEESMDTPVDGNEEAENNKDETSIIDSNDLNEKQEDASVTTKDGEDTENPSAENDNQINESTKDTGDESKPDDANKTNLTETETAEMTDKVNSGATPSDANTEDSSEDKIKEPNEALSKTEGSKDNKRKLSTEETPEAYDNLVKKPKIDKENKCIRPKGVKRVHKGATFWPSNFRQELCTCGECLSMYNDLRILFLTDVEDTVFAYEALGKERVNGRATQYEKGLEALSSLDRVQQINALIEYNKMKDKLLDFLKSFKDKKEVVKEEDIKAFFAGMKPKREPDGVYFCR